LSRILKFLSIAEDLEHAGLLWKPGIGDEVSSKEKPEYISILVDPQGMAPDLLRATYLWMPTVEQMVSEFEVRQVILSHAGLEISESSMEYITIVKSSYGDIESKGDSLRISVGAALRDLLLSRDSESVH